MDARIDKLHAEAMELVGKAMFLKDQDPSTYKKIMGDAFKIEKQAADLVYPKTEAEPGRSIIYQSAAHIAYDIERYEEAKDMIYSALSGTPPLRIATDLNNLLESIQFCRHLNQENMEISQNTLNVSLYGPCVGEGMVEWDAFTKRIAALRKMLMRIIQWNKFPTIFNSNKMFELKKDYPTFIKSLQPGCISVGLKVAVDETHESNLVDREIIETAISELAYDVELLNNEDFDSLKARIRNEGYYNSIVELYREMLPDGKNITGINLVAKVNDEPLTVCITKTKPEFEYQRETDSEQDPVVSAEIGSELILSGALRMADGRKNNPYVKLVVPSDPVKEYKVYLDEATIDDVVSAYWDAHVALKVLKKSKTKLVYLDIQST